LQISLYRLHGSIIALYASVTTYFWEMDMNHTKLTRRTARPSGLVQGLLIGLTLVSVLAAEPAMARRGRGLPSGILLVPLANPAAAPAVAPGAKAAAPAAQAATRAAALLAAGPMERPQAPKPLLRPTRHGSKPRGNKQ
jgi:hypothetical protein